MAGGPDRDGTGNQQGYGQREERSPKQPATDLSLDGLDIGEGIGEAHGTARNGSGHVKKRDAESRAAAFVLAGLAGKGGGELLAGGVVLHGAGIGLGVGKDFSGGVDDGGTGSGGLTFLRRDVREGMAAIDFYAMSEEQRLLRKVTLDLGTERGFPRTAQHDVENRGGGSDDDQEDGEQLEEDAVLHESGVLTNILLWNATISQVALGLSPDCNRLYYGAA